MSHTPFDCCDNMQNQEFIPNTLIHLYGNFPHFLPNNIELYPLIPCKGIKV